jgi:ribosomal protein S18 acetylase RimI-like enzyme
MTVTVRGTTIEDLPQLVVVRTRSWRAAYRDLLPSSVLGRLDDGPEEVARSAAWLSAPVPGRVNLVAVDRGEVVGYVAAGRERQDPQISEAGEVYALYVDPCRWRKGTGRLLLDAAMAQLAELSFTWVSVWTLSSNQPALSFYQANDFVPTGRTQTRTHLRVPETQLRRVLGRTT